jgi:cell wall-associated NlpC family hydrolase
MNANWSKHQGWCETAVGLAYTSVGFPTAFATSALADWNAQVAAGRAHPGNVNAPRGALVYFRFPGAYYAYGHVGISLGNGYYTSTTGSSNRIAGSAYLGWALPRHA